MVLGTAALTITSATVAMMPAMPCPDMRPWLYTAGSTLQAGKRARGGSNDEARSWWRRLRSERHVLSRKGRMPPRERVVTAPERCITAFGEGVDRTHTS